VQSVQLRFLCSELNSIGQRLAPKQTPGCEVSIDNQYSSASLMVTTRWVMEGAAGSGECLDMV
jgi:hypothetical protein